MPSARILLQRGLRLNSDSKKLWLEYFKLELLYLTKVIQRKEILTKNNNENNSNDEKSMDEIIQKDLLSTNVSIDEV